MNKREIFGLGGPGGYEMCTPILVEHMPEGLMIVRRDNGEEVICQTGMGTWCAKKTYDLFYDYRELHQRRLAERRGIEDWRTVDLKKEM